ncbi:MAG: peptide transporter ATPase [Gammaproteobacteria bacterium]|jgi:peptide/nickel transport system ATP-binding protein|nr:peptide transporter ATPase [Gammaproteobacteria bacterium]
MDENNLLEIKSLSVGFLTHSGFLEAVHDIHFTIPQGKTVAVIGESGCGKSLTAHAILQLLSATCRIVRGSHIYWKEQDLLTLPELGMRKIRGGELGIIFQEPMTSLNPVYTIGEQLKEAIQQHKPCSRKQSHIEAIALLNAVGFPEPALQLIRYPHELSGGMKQRVMIAMALAGEPDLLIADEPTTALDMTTQAQVLTLLQSIQRAFKMSILLITHDFGIAQQLADHVIVMYAGQIVESSSIDHFFEKPLHPYTQQLLNAVPGIEKRHHRLAVIPGVVLPLTEKITHCRFAARCPHADKICWEKEPQWNLLDQNQRVKCHLYDKHYPVKKKVIEVSFNSASLITKSAADAKSLLTISNLKIHFPVRQGLLKRKRSFVKAVDGVNLTLYEGRTLAIVGESGCGKTTLAKGILRLLPISGGGIHLNDQDLAQLSLRRFRHYRQQLQIIFQDPYSAFNPRLRVSDIILEGVRTLQKKRNLFQEESLLQSLLEQVGLPQDSADRYPHEFSGGQRQRIGIARALAVSPRILLCDEPTSALDVSIQAQILNLLVDLQKERNLTYLFISHNISVVSYLAHEIAVMYLGRIVEYGDAKTLLESPKHPYTQLLLSAVPTIKKPKEIVIPVKINHTDLPSAANPPQGCHFHPRCPFVMERCKQEYPGMVALNPSQKVACHLYEN